MLIYRKVATLVTNKLLIQSGTYGLKSGGMYKCAISFYILESLGRDLKLDIYNYIHS